MGKVGKTAINDETIKHGQYRPPPPQQNQNIALPANQYNAYCDPSNPGDIVLSVPFDDNEFDGNVGDEEEGKFNANDNLYGIAMPYAQNYDPPNAENKNVENNNVENKKPIAVFAGIEDDDDFEQRPKVKSAAIVLNKPPQNEKPAKLQKREKTMHKNGD